MRVQVESTRWAPKKQSSLGNDGERCDCAQAIGAPSSKLDVSKAFESSKAGRLPNESCSVLGSLWSFVFLKY